MNETQKLCGWILSHPVTNLVDVWWCWWLWGILAKTSLDSCKILFGFTLKNRSKKVIKKIKQTYSKQQQKKTPRNKKQMKQKGWKMKLCSLHLIKKKSSKSMHNSTHVWAYTHTHLHACPHTHRHAHASLPTDTRFWDFSSQILKIFKKENLIKRNWSVVQITDHDWVEWACFSIYYINCP